MHPAVFATFDRLCAKHDAGGTVLEIGATLGADTLLNLPALRSAAARTGVNLHLNGRGNGFEVVQANANCLQGFRDEQFDTILCNATLEHDARFWLTLTELRRLLARGGLAIVGVPGYVAATTPMRRLAVQISRRWPLSKGIEAFAASTPTLDVHNHPGDFYRFSPQAMGEVILQDLTVLETIALLTPPRLIGVGRKPAS